MVEAIEAKTPTGWTIRIIGHDVIIIALFVAVALFLVRINEKQEADHGAIVRELRINSYLLSLPPDQRPALFPPQDVWERTQQYQDWKRTQPKNGG